MSDRFSNEELARRMWDAALGLVDGSRPDQEADFIQHGGAVVERLRETCATCRHFVAPRLSTGACRVPPNDGVLFRAVPADGSGYCWKWERKS